MNRDGEEVFLTGGNTFVGSHVLAALLEAGHRVRALVPPGRAVPRHPRCTMVVGTASEAGRLVRTVQGCRYLVDTGGLDTGDVGAHDGTSAVRAGAACAGMLEAARLAGVERAVVTSPAPAVGEVLADDGPPPDDGRPRPPARLVRERAALAARVPAVVLMPTHAVGEGDRGPTAAGSLVLRFLAGRPLSAPGTPGGINLVDVGDVAWAHVLALGVGRPHERYVVAGEDVTLDDLAARLHRVTGRPIPRVPAWPHAAPVVRAAVTRRRTGGGAAVPPYADGSKARLELGFEPRTVDGALARAVAWYRACGLAA